MDTGLKSPLVPRPAAISLFLLSAAALTFEVNLTRLFSVAQFYHFAFMVVSIALLGYGASGTFLTLFPTLGQHNPPRIVGWLSLAAGLSMLVAYLLTNHLPFDSFSLAWDRRQVFILLAHYLALSLPFFFCGLATSLLLSTWPQGAGRTYAVSLFGSAAGCLIALLAPGRLASEGTVVLSIALAGLAGLQTVLPSSSTHHRSSHFLAVLSMTLLLISGFELAPRLAGRPGLPLFELRLSPYKSISYALQQPGAELILQRWNSYSRVDVVRSPGIHSLPGLSYRYLGALPPEDGLLVDGDDLSPLLSFAAEPALASGEAPGFTGYLPAGAAFRLRPQANVLVLEPRGGVDIVTAIAQGARQVTAVEVNPLIIAAAPQIYTRPRVRAVAASDRSYLRRSKETYDLVLLSLASSYHPVRSGAYSLGEDYRYTVEAFVDMLAHLEPQGLLVVTRWLQNPPSEELRTFALAVTALEQSGADSRQGIVALRGYNTATLYVKKSGFTHVELTALRAFAREMAFDLVFAPDIHPEEVNRFNILPEPVYYRAFNALQSATPRHDFYATYPFEVSPPTDDRPFFGHYFKWSQTGRVLAEVGKSWQPFGGAGYFVILALLALAILTSAVLILLPAAVTRRDTSMQNDKTGQLGARPGWLPALCYFGLIGLAYLLVEIPLIQRFILVLDQPAYAVTTVLFALLFFSGLGSRWNERFPLRLVLPLLALLLIGLPQLLHPLFDWMLGLPPTIRLGLAVGMLAVPGFLMGIPLPAGIRWLKTEVPGAPVAWVWAVNGSASVIASVLAALLALSFGFTAVLRLGALCYAAAWFTQLFAYKK